MSPAEASLAARGASAIASNSGTLTGQLRHLYQLAWRMASCSAEGNRAARENTGPEDFAEVAVGDKRAHFRPSGEVTAAKDERQEGFSQRAPQNLTIMRPTTKGPPSTSIRFSLRSL